MKNGLPVVKPRRRSSMHNGRNYERIVETAREHYRNLKLDIDNAQNRVEHIRLSALANEAHGLLNELVAFEVGLVYSHTNNVDDFIQKRLTDDITDPAEEPLDLPEFRSPFNPDA